METQALVRMIEDLLRTNRTAEAEAPLRDLVAVAADRPETWNLAAVVAQRHGRVDEALRHLDKALDLAPGFFGARYNRLLLLARLGRSADVVAGLDQLAVHPGFDAGLARRLVETSARLTDEARRAVLRLAVARTPADFGLALQLALLALRLGDDDEAGRVLRAASWPPTIAALDELPLTKDDDLVGLARGGLRAGRPLHAAFIVMKAHEAGAGVALVFSLLDTAVGDASRARMNVPQLLLNLWNRFPGMPFSNAMREAAVGMESAVTSAAESAAAAGRTEEAVRLFGFLAEAGLPYGRLYLANILETLGRLDEAERAYCHLVDRPEICDTLLTGWRDAGRFLLARGRPAEARPLLERALANREEPQTLEALGRALVELGEVEDGNRRIQRAEWLADQTLSMRAEAAFGDDITRIYADAAARPPSSARSQARAPWPVHAKDFEDYKRLATRYVLRNLPGPTRRFDHDVRIFTFGSCFAGNIARNLRKRGIRTYHADFFEDINTTFANRYLVEWLAHGPVGRQSKVVELCYGADARATVRDEMARAGIVVMTVGVAPSLFDALTGEPILAYGRSDTVLSQNNILRTSTVAENVANLQSLLTDIRLINPTAEVFLTLSPIPLRGTAEMSSAVIADCVSKSVLRVALHEIFSTGRPGVHYWPSFEIVRWLGSHLALQVFEDDGRHVREEHLDMIMDFFYSRHFQAAPVSAVSEGAQVLQTL